MDLIRQSTNTGFEVVKCVSPSEAPFNLLITYWGHGLSHDQSGIRRANAVELLEERIRALKLEVPVIGFASPDPEDVRANRMKAVSLSAFEYTWTFEGFFQSIENIYGHLINASRKCLSDPHPEHSDKRCLTATDPNA